MDIVWWIIRIDAVLAVVLGLMVFTGWWKNGSQHYWDKMKRKNR